MTLHDRISGSSRRRGEVNRVCTCTPTCFKQQKGVKLRPYGLPVAKVRLYCFFFFHYLMRSFRCFMTLHRSYLFDHLEISDNIFLSRTNFIDSLPMDNIFSSKQKTKTSAVQQWIKVVVFVKCLAVRSPMQAGQCKVPLQTLQKQTWQLMGNLKTRKSRIKMPGILTRYRNISLKPQNQCKSLSHLKYALELRLFVSWDSL